MAWIVFLCVLVLLVVATILLDKRDYKSHVLEWIGIAFMSLLQRGDYNNVTQLTSISSRFLQFILNLFTFFMFACYTALLTSFMTSKPEPSRIRNFGDIYHQNIHLLLWENTVSHLDMVNAPVTSWQWKYYKDKIEGTRDHFIKDANEIQEALDKYPNSLYYSTRTDLYSFEPNGEEYVSYEKTFDDTYYGFAVLAFPIDSEYTDLFRLVYNIF